MTQLSSHSPHSVDLIFGVNAIDAFNDQELPEDVLRALGAWKTFSFLTWEECQAFLDGVKEARGYENVEILNVVSDYPLPDPSNLP